MHWEQFLYTRLHDTREQPRASGVLMVYRPLRESFFLSVHRCRAANTRLFSEIVRKTWLTNPRDRFQFRRGFVLAIRERPRIDFGRTRSILSEITHARAERHIAFVCIYIYKSPYFLRMINRDHCRNILRWDQWNKYRSRGWLSVCVYVCKKNNAIGMRVDYRAATLAPKKIREIQKLNKSLIVLMLLSASI